MPSRPLAADVYDSLPTADRRAFVRALGCIATAIGTGELAFTVSRGRICDARLTRKEHIPEGGKGEKAIEFFLGLDSRAPPNADLR